MKCVRIEKFLDIYFSYSTFLGCENSSLLLLIVASSRVDNSANQTQSKSLNLQKTSVAYRNGHHLLRYVRAPHRLTSSRFYKQKLLKCYLVSTVSVYIKSERKKKHTDHFDYNTLLQSCVLKINAPSQIWLNVKSSIRALFRPIKDTKLSGVHAETVKILKIFRIENSY